MVDSEVFKVEFDGLSGVCRRLLDGAAVRKAARKQRDYYRVSALRLGNQIDPEHPLRSRRRCSPSTAFSAPGHDIFVNGWRRKVSGVREAVTRGERNCE